MQVDFGPFRLDPSRRVLWHDGRLVALPPKALDLLAALVRRRGDVASKDELLREVWPDVIVEEANLAVHVSELRRAFSAAAGGDAYIQTVPRRGYRFVAATTAAWRTLAVLPFQVLDGDAAGEQLGVGIADSLIARLSYLRQLSVRPTSAVMRHAGSSRDPRELGRELDAELVLEGRIRRAGDAIRVVVQLLSVDDGGAPLWAESFDGPFASIFAVEDRIAVEVADALALELQAGERAQQTRHHTENVEAYEDHVTGRFFWSKLTRDSVARAMMLFQSAIARDPGYALPHAGLADAYLVMGFSGFVAPKLAWQLAGASAARALELDETLAEAHTSLGYVKLFSRWDWAGAGRELLRAIALKPRDAAARQWYALYLYMLGRFDDAAREIRTARELDPVSLIVREIAAYQQYLAHHDGREAGEYHRLIELDPSFFAAHWGLGLAEELLGRHDEMLAEHRRAVELSDGSPMMKTVLARSLFVAGRADEAAVLHAELEALSAGVHVASYPMATVEIAAGRLDRAVDRLERACDEQDPWMVWIQVDPMLDPLRDDPRFQALLARVGLSARV